MIGLPENEPATSLSRPDAVSGPKNQTLPTPKVEDSVVEVGDPAECEACMGGGEVVKHIGEHGAIHSEECSVCDGAGSDRGDLTDAEWESVRESCEQAAAETLAQSAAPHIIRGELHHAQYLGDNQWDVRRNEYYGSKRISIVGPSVDAAWAEIHRLDAEGVRDGEA